MKKTILLITLVIIFLGAIGQTDDIFTGKKKDKTEKSGNEKKSKDKDTTTAREKSSFIIPDMSMNIDYGRGFVVGLGIRIVGVKKNNSNYVTVNFSFPFYKSTNTALGLFYKTNPIHGSFGRHVGVGAEVVYFYQCALSSYTEWFYGGKLSNTFGPAGGVWYTKRLVFAPRLDFLFPVRNGKIGISSNPLVIGYWDYDKDTKSFGVCRRWYNISLMYQQSFPTKKLKAFKEVHQKRN